MIIPLDEFHKTLVLSQHWFRQWLGAVRQQAITWAKVDPDLCRHMASLGANEPIRSLENPGTTMVRIWHWTPRPENPVYHTQVWDNNLCNASDAYSLWYTRLITDTRKSIWFINRNLKISWITNIRNPNYRYWKLPIIVNQPINRHQKFKLLISVIHFDIPKWVNQSICRYQKLNFRYW